MLSFQQLAVVSALCVWGGGGGGGNSCFFFFFFLEVCLDNIVKV